MTAVSNYRIHAKSQWLGTMDYNGEECEIFIQEGAWIQVCVVPTNKLKNQVIDLAFYTQCHKRES